MLFQTRATLIVTCFALLQFPVYGEQKEVNNLDQSNLATIKLLQQQIFALSTRILALESSVTEKQQLILESPISSKHPQVSVTMQKQQPLAKAGWTDRVRITGDLRSRYENINDDLKPEDQNRHRIRARLAIATNLSDRWSAGIGLATGGDSPVSSNQTLGGGGTTKELGLDLAYINLRLSENLDLRSGKFKNPFYRVGNYHMVWDSDYRPEGFAFNYENGRYWATGMVHFLESDNGSGSKDAETSYGMQAGVSQALSDNIKLKAGVSYYHFDVQGSKPLFKNAPLGNTVSGDGTYTHNYRQIEFFTELSTVVADIPVSGFVDYVNNLDVDSQDTAWALGFKLGKASAAKTWELAYRYQRLEADALYAAITDSDFAGGVSDSRGHIIEAAYAPYNNTRLSLKYFATQYGKHNAGVSTEYDRLQLDVALKF